MCEQVGASLFVVHHSNRQRDLSGAARMSGAGPAEWGRVLITAAIKSRHTDPDTQATTVLTELEVQGGEVPDQTIRVRRTIRADNPDDLDSSLHYGVDEPDQNTTAPEPGGTAGGHGLTPAATKLLAALDNQATPAPIDDLVDHIKTHHGHGLRRPTCSTELNKLRTAGLVDYLDTGPGRERLWYRVGKDAA